MIGIFYFNDLENFLRSPLTSHVKIHIDLMRQNIVAQSIEALETAFASCSNLKSLDLSLQVNSLGAQGAKVLGKSLKNCSTLQDLTISLEVNQIGAKGAINLCSALTKCANIETLTLSLRQVSIRKYYIVPEILQENLNNQLYCIFCSFCILNYFKNNIQYQNINK
ncbi:hypothetical protein ABPG73_017054 [Tetrahymena malaccensis]